MKRSLTFAKQKAAPVKGAGGLASPAKKQQVKASTQKPGHRVQKAKRPPPFAKPKPRGL